MVGVFFGMFPAVKAAIIGRHYDMNNLRFSPFPSRRFRPRPSRIAGCESIPSRTPSEYPFKGKAPADQPMNLQEFSPSRRGGR
jgi:hypothetical protein